jgi:hypothetical protein
MAGILVEYARFVEVQQRRARVASLPVPPLGDTPAEAKGSAAAEQPPIEIAESRREFRSMQIDGDPIRSGRNDEHGQSASPTRSV